MKRLVLSMTAAMALAAPVWAKNSDLLIIGNSDQGVLQRLTGSGDFSTVRTAFESRGAEVSLATEADTTAMMTAFRAFADNLDATTDDVAVILTGRILSTIAGSYLMPAGSSENPELAQVVTEGFSIDAVYAVAARYPGRALVVLGEVETEGNLSDGVTVGFPVRDIPQGVTVAVGPAANVDRFVKRLSESTGDDVLPLARSSGLSLLGFVPQELPLLLKSEQAVPEVKAVDTPVTAANTATVARAAADEAAWKTAVTADTEASYETYLSAFPDGKNIGEGRQRLTTIRSEPFYREKQAETNLNLSRDARREIQRDLSLLGYNTRGIDGIFGRGTRGAVTTWQTDNGIVASGYLSSDQIARLDAQAERRAAELEEEARQRQADLERQDRAFWAETGARGDEPGFRAYLKRFPDGAFAEVAEDRLASIEAQRRDQAEAQDNAQWQAARQTDTADAYRTYLAQRPNGAFSEEARARIEWFERNVEQVAVEQRGQADESSLGLNAAAMRLAEARLNDLGLQPGAVDGVFDEDTRRAIRRYQDARNLRVSGYLDQATVVRLMADTILR
jgi:peptidoglycan hydrolase-like protein with peptidoglycan-binding domain